MRGCVKGGLVERGVDLLVLVDVKKYTITSTIVGIKLSFPYFLNVCNSRFIDT